MPRIKDYTSQESAAGPITVSSNPNQFGAAAYQGLANLGSGVEDAASFLEKRAAQAEVSDLHGQISEATVKHTKGLADALKNTDPSDTKAVQAITENFSTQYDADMDKIRQNINTPGARNFFERSSEGLKAKLLESAIHIQSELTGDNNRLVNGKAVNNFSSSILTNPSQFDAFKSQYEAGVDAQVAHGGLSVSAAQEMKAQAAAEFAKSSVLGWADLGSVGPQEARDQLMAGKYDKYINGVQKQELLGRIQAKESFNRTEQLRIKAQEQDAATKAQEAVKQQMFPKIFDGSLSLKDVWNNPTLTADQKLQIQKLTDVQAREGAHQKTDPATFNDFFSRIHNLDDDNTKPPVTDKDLENAVISGKLSMDGPESLSSLRREMSGVNTPEGKALQASKNAVNFAVRQNLGFDNEHHVFKDNQGPENNSKWITFENQKEADQRAKGKPVADLYNATSPDYILPSWRQFSNNTSQIMNNMLGKTGGNGSDNRNPQATGPLNTYQANVEINPGMKAGSLSAEDLAAIKAGKPLPNDGGKPAHIYDFSDLTKTLGAGSGRVDQIMRLYSGADEKGKSNFIKELKDLGYTGPLPGDQHTIPKPQPASGDAVKKPGESIEDFLKRRGVK